MQKVLIERIGGDVSQGIVKSILEDYPQTCFVGVDRNPNCGWQGFVSSFVLECDMDKTEGIRFPYSQKGDMADVCNDKWYSYDLLYKNGIPVPQTLGSYISKPREGSGGKDVHYRNEVAQEYLAGKEITCPIYVTKDGEIRILQLQRILQNGCSVHAKVIDNETVWDVCYRLALLLKFKGAFNIQLMLTKEGPKVFEINPRFSSTVYMRHLLGFKDAVWAYQELMGLPIAPMPTIKVGQEVVRVQSAKLIEGI